VHGKRNKDRRLPLQPPPMQDQPALGSGLLARRPFVPGTRRGPGHRSAVAPHFMVRDLDALIVVSSPWVDGASAAAQTMEWLANHGMAELIHRTVVVLNDSDGHADRRTRTILAQHFADHGRVVIEVPFDPHLRPGGVIDVTNEMSPKTRRRFYVIAAAIAEHFSSTAPGPREQRFR
jgi:MinD-like ATPase involved in chromosome partitioning or flagellar assembly